MWRGRGTGKNIGQVVAPETVKNCFKTAGGTCFGKDNSEMRARSEE